jgi:hypothetical protein
MSSDGPSRAVCDAATAYRWIVFATPWWQCVAEALPFLMGPGDTSALASPGDYPGPGEHGEHHDVILNPHRCAHLASVFEAHSDRVILYETENMLDLACFWRKPSEALRRACPSVRWWNYSAANARAHGDHVHPLRQIHEIPRRKSQIRPIDVLFVGSINDRRARLLEALKAAGIRVYSPKYAVFGDPLARLEAAAKLALNVHFYEPGVFEAFRVVPARHRGTPVLSETSVEGEGESWCPAVPYERLVDEIVSQIRHP